VESEEPAIIFKLSIYTREDSPAISDLENLKGKRVLLMQGYSYGQVGKFLRKTRIRCILTTPETLTQP